MFPYSALSGLTVDTYFCQSTEAWCFTLRVKVVLEPWSEVDSVLCWELLVDFTHFHDEGGRAPEVDSCSCVSLRSLLDEFSIFSSCRRIRILFTSSLYDGRFQVFCRILRRFFALRPHGRECPVFSPR